MGATNNSYYEKKLDNPLFPIIAIDNRFSFPEPKIFYLYEGGCCEDPYIQDNNGITYFKLKQSFYSSLQTIYDTYNKPLFNIDKHYFSFDYKIKYGETDEIIANLDKNKFSNYTKYTCTFKNLATGGLNDFVEIKSVNDDDYFSVYQGEEKKGAPLICKIYRNPNLNCCSSLNFIIENSANIDSSLMIGLAFIFRDIGNINS